ncbi:MAG TPA: VOC family protein [Steroidobacteraceae bacterium]
MHAELDHLVVTAPTLDMGADFVTQALGVPLDVGGDHPLMGTHNLVLRLGNSSYLEVIAINPASPRPERPRWFALDCLSGNNSPRLATWVARTSSVDLMKNPLAPIFGNVDSMTRGSLRWRITIPAGGALLYGGLVPLLIEWQSAVHPASHMRDFGCSLMKLEALHPKPEQLCEELRRLDLSNILTISGLKAPGPPYLVAHIETPGGVRLLGI